MTPAEEFLDLVGVLAIVCIVVVAMEIGILAILGFRWVLEWLI